MNVLAWTGVVVMGGAGSVLRFLVDRAVSGRVKRSLPFGTLTVNVTGAVVLGLVSGLVLNHGVALVAGTAAIGSYTTFSTWMFETQRLGEERQFLIAGVNIILSIVVGLAAAMLGQAIGTHL